MNWWKHLDPEEGDQFNSTSSSTGGTNNTTTPVKEETKELTKLEVSVERIKIRLDPYSNGSPGS